MKNGFILYYDYEEHFELLSDEELGMLIRAIYKYEKTGEVPELVGLSKMAFSFIKSNLDTLRDKYEKQVEKNKENGAKGGRPKKANKSKVKQNKPKVTDGFSDKPKKNLIDKDINTEMDKGDKSSSNGTCIYKQVIDYLNLKAGTNFKTSNKIARDKIKARLNEGYKLQDFIVVVDKKYEDWINDSNCKYLRPSTLFGNRFDEYLNQKATKQESNKNLNNNGISVPNKSKFVNYEQRTRDYDELERLAQEHLKRETDKIELPCGIGVGSK